MVFLRRTHFSSMSGCPFLASGHFANVRRKGQKKNVRPDVFFGHRQKVRPAERQNFDLTLSGAVTPKVTKIGLFRFFSRDHVRGDVHKRF